MGLFQNILKKKAAVPEAWNPNDKKCQALLEACFGDPAAVFKAIDKETGMIRPGSIHFINPDAVERIASFLNAPNAEEFKTAFKARAKKAMDAVQALIKNNTSDQYLKTTDHCYFTAMISLGTSASSCMENIVTRAKQEAQDALDQANREAAELQQRENDALAEQQKRDAAAQQHIQKQKERSEQAQERRDQSTVKKFKEDYLHKKEWEELLADIAKLKTEGDESSDKLHSQIEEALADEGKLKEKLKEFHKMVDEANKEEQERLAKEIKDMIKELRDKLKILGKKDSSIYKKVSRLKEQLQTAYNAAIKINVGDPRMDVATEVINEVEAYMDRLNKIGFNFQEMLENNTASNNKITGIEEEVTFGK